MNAVDLSIHPFERASLGKAPFRVIGSAERVHVIPGVACRAGGSCHYCGTGIRYAAIIRSADGHVFDVGLDCVRKVDGEMYRDARRSFRDERGREAREKAEWTREQEKQLRAVAEAERERAYRERNPETMAIVDMLHPLDGFAGDFAARCLQNVRGNGCLAMPSYRETLQEVEHAAHWKLCELRAEHRAQGYVGEVGKRWKKPVRATFVGRVMFDSAFGVQNVYKFEVANEDGTFSMLTWKTGSALNIGEEYAPKLIGRVLDIIGTTKAHTEFRGVAQTSLTRVKVSFPD